MKTTIVILMALTVAAFAGCASPRGGSMSSDEGFKVAAPYFTTDLKQGDSKTVTVSLKRDKYFKQDVTLRVTVTSGITVEPTKITVRDNESPDVQLQITAPQKAALGEYLVHIHATPETGSATSTDFTVKVIAP